MFPIKLTGKFSSFVLFLFIFSRSAIAQITEPQDTVGTAKQDTTGTAKKSDEKEGKRKDVVIFYAGINFNYLNVSSDKYESRSGAGWHLGGAYRRGGFFYWQLGVRFNSAKYDIKSAGGTDTTHDSFTVTDLDIPITGGINFLPFTNRVFNVRLFLSAVPAFGLSLSDNSLGIVKDSINTFNFYGQAGVGVDVLFIVLDIGYNYGFSDLLKSVQSNPGQVFINLGVRF